jgi:FkbM family methyltransferase
MYMKAFLRLVRGRNTVVTVEGMTFQLDLSEMIDVCVYLSQYERDVVTAIERVCRRGSCVLDIGANIGVHTLRFARTVGESGRVYAFEPMEYAYRKLVRNVSLNAYRNITAVQIALAERNVKQQRLYFRSSWATDGKRVDHDTIVDSERLDDWCVRLNLERVDLIKLDVDGNEFSVLSGAPLLLERCRPVIILEVAAYHFEDTRTNPLLTLQRLGYRFADPMTGLPYEGPDVLQQRCQVVESVNVLARPW